MEHKTTQNILVTGICRLHVLQSKEIQILYNDKFIIKVYKEIHNMLLACIDCFGRLVTDRSYTNLIFIW